MSVNKYIMPASKTHKQLSMWEVQVYYTDYQGSRRKKHKRGFKTQREAKEWEREFRLKQNKKLDMYLQSLVELYLNDMTNRIRENTMRSKKYIIELKILPYFGKRKVLDIKASDIREWQNEIAKQGYKPTYLKAINNQLTAIFNYAVKYYDLPQNPCVVAGTMGKGRADEMGYWTKEEFEQFLEHVSDKPIGYYAFMMMFWTGIRVGELLALTIGDVDFENMTLTISKSLQRIESRNVITEPKTERGKRVITLSDFLLQELNEYVGKLYGMTKSDRLFQITKAFLEHEIKRGIELSGVKKIRLHDLRHSHASFLISKLNIQPLLVAQRLGHQRIQTTMDTYIHLYPNQTREVADLINSEKLKGDNDAF